MFGFHGPELFMCGVPLFLFVIPWVIGFAWVLPDANRHGQPGWLWAILTLPLGWFAILAYAVVRAVRPAAPPQM